MNIYADLIRLVHYCIVAFLAVIPYLNIKNWLDLYLFIVPYLMIQWYIFKYNCGLTVFESALRNIPYREGFIYNVLKPIFNFQSEKNFNGLLNAYLVFSWIYVLTKTHKI